MKKAILIAALWWLIPIAVQGAPTITKYPHVVGIACTGMDWQFQFEAESSVGCEDLDWSVHAVGLEPFGDYSIDQTGLFTFVTDDLDGGMSFLLLTKVTDNCDQADSVLFMVEVLPCSPFLIRIEKTENALQGHYEYVSVIYYGSSWQMAGYDFLIGYDASALTFLSATIGDALGPEGCGWEYFTYRYGALSNCSGPCPSGYIRLVSIADIANGPNHPNCFNPYSLTSLADLKLRVTDDRSLNCQFVPIRFVWQDCGDNAISSPSGDTLYISQKVFTDEWDGGYGNADPYEITGSDCDSGWGFNFGGACAWCDTSYKVTPVRLVRYWNGGVRIACSDSIDARGDVNLNGIANEIADAVLFASYFLYGIGVFDVAPNGQIAATDINDDGWTLWVDDLVYLIRIITGDALPYPKLVPFSGSVEINMNAGRLSTNSETEIGAVYAVYNTAGNCEVINNTDMELASNQNVGQLRVLLFSGLTDAKNRLPAGYNELITVVGDAELASIEVSDYYGNMLNTKIGEAALPSQYSLHQNVPNPFNPTTRISFDLPCLSGWTLGIYNVAGQLVKDFSGSGLGPVTVEWDAHDFASGVYFYRLSTQGFSDTRKMVLMK